MRQTHTLPCWSSASPYGLPDILYSTILPELTSSRPTRPAPCMVNQIVPLPSLISVCGSPPDGVLYSVTLPVAGSRWPIVPLPLPVYHAVLSAPAITPCGCAPRGSSHSLNVCVLGSKRAILSPCITLMKMLPSGAGAGSRANSGVGTGHSCTLPWKLGRAPGATV